VRASPEGSQTSSHRDTWKLYPLTYLVNDFFSRARKFREAASGAPDESIDIGAARTYRSPRFTEVLRSLYRVAPPSPLSLRRTRVEMGRV
jgi:hypothetical protein